MNNIITASRLNSLISCPRKHFWSYEIGLRKKEKPSLALRFGTAWAKAMDARWSGATYDEALAIAIPEGIDLDAYACATIAGLLAGYYDYYGKREKAGKIHPEVQFDSEIEGTDFRSQGKMDGLGSLKDGRSVLVEAKTTGSPIDPGSDYWLRLRFNIQVLHYVSEARKLGWELAEAFYDVTRKPQIEPKQVCDLDKDGLKIVLDKNGRRVFGKNDKPRQSGDEEQGWTVKTHIETPDEFGDRLWKDIGERPEFYFKRHEIPIIDQEVEDFERQRFEMVNMITHFRSQEWGKLTKGRDPQAWPRNVSVDTCNWCDYKNFCLQNISVDLNRPPQGFSIQPFNQELEPTVEAKPKE